MSSLIRFLKLCVLIRQPATRTLQGLMTFILHTKQKTLEEILNDHQHLIYHLYTSRKCCQCITQPTNRNPRVIKECNMQLMYNINATFNPNCQSTSDQYCCRKAKDLNVEQLDITLLWNILTHVLHVEIIKIDVQRYYSNDLEEFFKKNMHFIFHLWEKNTCCCLCHIERIKVPKTIRKSDFDGAYSKKSQRIPECRLTPMFECPCAYKVKENLSLENMSDHFLKSLLVTSSQTYKCLEEINAVRNLVSHNTENQYGSDISTEDYDDFTKRLKDAIDQIEEVTGFQFWSDAAIEELQSLVNTGKMTKIELENDVSTRTIVFDMTKMLQAIEEVQQEWSKTDKVLVEGKYSMLSNKATRQSLTIKSKEGSKDFELEYFQLRRIENESDEETDDPNDYSVRCKRCNTEYTSFDLYNEHNKTCKRPLKRKRQADDSDTLEKRVKLTVAVDDNKGGFEQITLTRNVNHFSTIGFIHDLIEKGSLVFWTRMKTSVAKSNEQLVDNVDKLMCNIMNNLPNKKDETETKFSVKLEVLDSSEDDDDVTFICKRCNGEFNSLSSFGDHRKLCRRKSHQKPPLDKTPKQDKDPQPQGLKISRVEQSTENKMEESHEIITITSPTPKMLVAGTKDKDFFYDSSTSSGYETGSTKSAVDRKYTRGLETSNVEQSITSMREESHVTITSSTAKMFVAATKDKDFFYDSSTSSGYETGSTKSAVDRGLESSNVEQPITSMREESHVTITSSTPKMLVAAKKDKDFFDDSNTSSGYETGAPLGSGLGSRPAFTRGMTRKRHQNTSSSPSAIVATSQKSLDTDLSFGSGYDTASREGTEQVQALNTGEKSVKRRKGTSAKGRRKKQSRRDSRSKSENTVLEIEFQWTDDENSRYFEDQLDETMSFISDSDDDISSPLESPEIQIADKEELGFKKISTNYFEKSRALVESNARKSLKDTSMSQSGLKLSNKCLRDLRSLSIARVKKYKNYYKTFDLSVEELNYLCQQDAMTRRGRLQIQSSHEAVVRLEEPYHGNEEIIISGRSKCGKAFTDDDVVVKIYEPTGHTTHINRLKKDILTNLYGEIIGIIKRNLYEGVDHPVFVCELDKYEYDKAKPICKTIPKLHLLYAHKDDKIHNEPRPFTVDVFCYNEDRNIITYKESIPISPAVRSQYLFYVAYISWEGLYPLGAIIKVHNATKKFIDGLSILELRYKVPTLYEHETVRCVENSDIDMAFEKNKKGRNDLTDCTRIFTIDPKESTVLDDAVNIERLPNGGFRVGVHITDVSPFIPKDSALDVEAHERGTTFFRCAFGNPHQMIPEIISTKRCSLVPKQKRLTFSVFFNFDNKLQCIHQDTMFCKSIIMSSHQMSYAEAQDIIQNNKESEFRNDVLLLYRISEELRQKRLGYRSFFIPTEYNFSHDDENITKYPEAYHMIEELMVLTNHYVAKFLLSKFPGCLPLRCQDPPQDIKLAEWTGAYPKIADAILDLQCYPKRLRSNTLLNIDNILLPVLKKNTRGQEKGQNDVLAASEGQNGSMPASEGHNDGMLASKGQNDDFAASTSDDFDLFDSKEPHEYAFSLKRSKDKFASTMQALDLVSTKNKIVIRCNDIIFIQKWLWEAAVKSGKSDLWSASHLLRQEEMHPFHCIVIEDWRNIQNTAEYRCSGGVQGLGVKCKHFGLGTFPYVHFTAPIRRFVDLMVHRLFHAALGNEDSPYSQLEIVDSCRHLNDCETRAKNYQRHCKSLIMAQNLQKNPIVVNGFVDEFTDKELTLIIPGCGFLNPHCKKIKINLLGVSERPEYKLDVDKFNSPAKRDYMTLKWKKRIYSAHKKMAFPKSPFDGYTFKERGGFQKLDPNQKTEVMQTYMWIRCLKSVIAGNGMMPWEPPRDDLEPGEKLSRSFLLSSNHTENDINSEVVDPTRKYSNNADKLMITEQFCKFSMAFHRGQVVTVQMASEMQKGMLTPYIQVVDLTQGIKVCLEHMRDPVGCLEYFSTESTKQRYDDSQHYIRTWLPILDMENAINVVRENSITINDLNVNFSTSEGYFILRADFCYERHIDFTFGFTTVRVHDKDDKKDSSTISSDYLCIKCVVSHENHNPVFVKKQTPPSDFYILVVHAKIKKIMRYKRDTPEENIKVCFDIIDNSKLYLPKKARCSVEVMQKPDINKRIDIAIQEIGKSTKLSKAIALNRKIPDLDNEYLELASTFKDDIDIGLPENNEQQKKAIKHALTSTFTLIHGPPGTGKTNVGIKLVCLFAEINQLMEQRSDEGVRRKKIVYCGPSNKSVDLVADRLLRLNHKTGLRLARLYGSSIEGLDYPIPGRVHSTRGSGDCKSSDSLKPICIHHLVRQKGKPHAKEIEELYHQLTTTKFEVTKEADVLELERRLTRHGERNRVVKKTGQKTEIRQFVDLTKHKEYVEVLHTATIEELKQYDVIFCTTAMATNQKLLTALEGDIFQLIIDECGMCTEPESVATIIATKAEQVVLIGDHKQLQPVVVCPQAEKLGLQRSLFERYKSDANVCPLKVQYRMHPSICEFPSSRFYNGKLTTDSKSTSYIEKRPLKTWIYPERRFVFCHVFGEEQILPVKTEEGNEMSRRNMEEIEQVMKIYKYLKNDEKIFQKHGKEGKLSLNIMSQYNAQCAAVRQKLSKHDLENVSVNTVVSSQGGEWDYVIFSLVRSLPDFRIEKYPTRGWCAKNLGFITDVHQINVALTRARKGLFIIGNKDLLRCDDNWAELLKTYDRKGCLFNASVFPFVRKNDPPLKRRKKEPSQTDEDGFETVSYRK